MESSEYYKQKLEEALKREAELKIQEQCEHNWVADLSGMEICCDTCSICGKMYWY